MKRLVSICLVSMLATPAFASKSRVNSLQGRLGLIDNQTLFVQPAYIHQVAPNANFEFGSSAVAGNPKAEGGFVSGKDGTRFGAYLGHVSPFQTTFRSTGTFQNMDNPVDVFFGSGNWGANFAVSNSEDKTTNAKQTTVIARGGMISGQNEFAVSADLYGTAEKTTAGVTDEFKSEVPALELRYLNRQESMLWAVNLAYGSGENKIANVSSDTSVTSVAAAFNRFLSEEVYWGAGVEFSELESGGKKLRVTTLPVFLGLERDMTAWLAARASIQQNFLLGSTKNDIAGTSETKNLNDTRVAAGLGFKHNNFTIDGTLAATTTGKFNGNDFLTQASLTYNF